MDEGQGMALAPMTQMEETMQIEDVRKKIDETDDQILELFLQRMDCAGQIAELKRENSAPVLDKTREREILKKVREKAGDKERYANSVYNTILSVSRAYQNSILQPKGTVNEVIDAALANRRDVFPQTGMIACPGVEGSFSQMATDRMFPRGNIMYVDSFEAVFDSVKGGLCDFGVVPIENSSNGSVRAVYELLEEKQAYIVRSERLFVRHELLAKPGTRLEDIKTVCSHEQAIGQCSRFLSSLDGVEVERASSTSEAVKRVGESDEKGLAAIGSHVSGELYGLAPVSNDIQNSDNNYTRFICIAREPCIYPGANRISLVLTCKHQPGSLYEVLGKFAALGINLLKLESYPIVGHDFDFMFYFDLEASVREEGIPEMLADLENDTESLVFLGNYAEV